MKQRSNKYLIAALILALIFHGGSIFYTIEKTYDALIHQFFAGHYANNWFEHWNPKWYTGFTVQSYPPLVHQSIGLLSLIGGLKFGLFSVAIICIMLFVTGAYRFALLISSNRTVAGYAAIMAVFSSSFIETLHLFGQLPSIAGISILMHALPEIYLWLRSGKIRYLFISLSLISVTVTSHHVTPIFGMVFFIFPLIGTALLDDCKEELGDYKQIRIKHFIAMLFKRLKRIVTFGFSTLFIIIGCILPYWLNTKSNPITQVPIPHGSRDNFLEVTSSGLVFFFIPWGFLLLIMPYIFYRYYHKRYIFFGLSITVLTILGTGGTTPIPRMMLGDNAFNILTLDRFTLWATIMSIPIMGEFAYRFIDGDLKQLIQNRIGAVYHRLAGGLLAGLFILMGVFTLTLGYFRPSQPQKIKMLPIVNFLNQDDHYKWRFLTLGFGDQMAWLSAQTKALSVDGNYHSARRLPELTTRPIERLENSKFQGVAGIGSLQQFLTTPNKYNLKYIFSNDKFYDPILYFCGWQRLRQLENGIMVWERLNVPPLSSILPKDEVPKWRKLAWGIIPVSAMLIAMILNFQMLIVNTLKTKEKKDPLFLNFKIEYNKFPRILLKIGHLWAAMVMGVIFFGLYLFYIKNDTQRSPENAILAYYDHLDFKRFEDAFEMISPNSGMTLDQFMLEVSVTDGLLSSYAKLDAITFDITEENDSMAIAEVNTVWITPLEKINKKEIKQLREIKNKWYVLPDKLDTDIPPDQLYTQAKTKFFNQGRRRITTEQTHHEDVLKQPVLEVLDAKLIEYDNHYAIVGEIQNIDNVPADVVVNGSLYNDQNKLLATFNAKHIMKHKLMPKEKTAFRVDFEGIAWSNIDDEIPETFDPDEFTPVDFEEPPSKFNLQVAGNVANTDLSKIIAVSHLIVEEEKIHGQLFNSGIEEVTIPELLISYYDENNSILWVDYKFVKDGIRQQRKRDFEYDITDIGHVNVLNTSMENVFVNGLPNDQISRKTLPNRNNELNHLDLQNIEHPQFQYLKIDLNAYIGNPN